jgi:hypothetical protein
MCKANFLAMCGHLKKSPKPAFEKGVILLVIREHMENLLIILIVSL